MAAWRKKAYALFGFEPGEYSFAQGKVDLFADLVAMAETAIAQDDEEMLDRITEYVCWAANQTADDVASAVQMTVERCEHPLARHHALREPVGEILRAARVRDPEADDGNRRLEVVLLEEHPLQDLRTLVRIGGNEAGAFSEVPEDRAGLAERTAVVEHERRDAE